MNQRHPRGQSLVEFALIFPLVVFLLMGFFDVTLNYSDVYDMKTGDSMYFKSTEFHNWMNPGKKTSQILWVHSPVER